MDIHHSQSTCHTCCSTSCRPELFRQKQEGPRTSACRALQSCSRRNLGCMALTSSLSFGHSKPMQTSLAGVVSTFSPWVPATAENRNRKAMLDIILLAVNDSPC